MHSPVLTALLCAALLAGCSAVPLAPQRDTKPDELTPASRDGLGSQIASAALNQLGRPYQYGGNGPDTFDCSGLVRFAHGSMGVLTPRTTAEQWRASRPVEPQDLSPGDLLFFTIGAKVSHVGIYAGDGRFVHAPQTGRPVETRALADPFYKARLAKIGRFY
jgi:murein DD-endopeptidase